MPEPIYDTSKPVLVTGATGYVAGWIVKGLLERGFTVHGTVRDPGNAAKVAHLTALTESLPGELKLFRAELLEPGSFAGAMAGCGVVIHTASPFVLSVEDPQRDLVDPAVKGTHDVLDEATRTGSVTRVVLTSSCAAIYGDTADVGKAPGGVLTEEVWNTTSSLTHNTYSYSKVMAERTAWEIAGAQDRWRLVVMNPALIVGPGVAATQTSESFNILRQLGDGTSKSGTIHSEIGVVDVRDVAEAHIRAAFIPEAEGRHILARETISFLQMADALRPTYGAAYPLPKTELPKWLLWLVGPMLSDQLSRRFIAQNVGFHWQADNTKSRAALGIDYRPIGPALNEMFQTLIDNGTLKPR